MGGSDLEWGIYVAEWIFGDVPGNPEGMSYANRKALAAAGVHAPVQAGIWGRASEGAVSIVLNGGYEDDIDEGDYVIYTGHGGQDLPGGRQVRDQELASNNLALARNALTGCPFELSEVGSAIRGFRPLMASDMTASFGSPRTGVPRAKAAIASFATC